MKVSQDAFPMFQENSVCAWWTWTVQRQRKNTATLFKWYLWSQRAALPKTTWLWASPCRMWFLHLMSCHWLHDKSPRAFRELLVYYWNQRWASWACWKLQEDLGRGTLLLCVKKDDWLPRGNPLKPHLPKSHSHWPSFHQQDYFLTRFPILSVRYSIEAISSQPSFYNL